MLGRLDPPPAGSHISPSWFTFLLVGYIFHSVSREGVWKIKVGSWSHSLHSPLAGGLAGDRHPDLAWFSLRFESYCPVVFKLLVPRVLRLF